MTAEGSFYPLDGGCDCGVVRYRMETQPLVVHCCHCRWCQRESGASFALNAMIEADRVVHLGSEPEIIDTPSNSGKGQKIARCPTCRIAVWSTYAGAALARLTRRISCDRTYTSLLLPNSRGSSFLRTFLQFRNTTIVKSTGRLRVLPAVWQSCLGSRPIRRRCAALMPEKRQSLGCARPP